MSANDLEPSGTALCSAVSLHEGDDVAVMVTAGHTGDNCTVELANGNSATLCLGSEIPFGHKISLRMIETGGVVKKYGVPIGRATEEIAAGVHVHIHNLVGFKSDLTGGR